MKILVLVLIGLLCSLELLSQSEGTINGFVRDTKGNPIIDAAVIYKKDLTRGALANEHGFYEMKVPPGKAMLICRYSGMVTDTMTVIIVAGETLSRDIILREIVTEIEGVNVRVGKFDKPLEDQTVSMEIIRPEMIENKNTRSIETALDQTPGLNILDGEPQIRGGSGFTFGVGSKVAVIVDDMPMLSGDAGRPEWGFIPVENIHQIEVIKGASSVLSGSSALSGAIHIRTKYPGLKPLTKVNLYTGLYSKPSIEGADWWTGTPLISGANFLHSRRVGNLDVVLGANVNYDHGYIGPPITDSLVYADTISNFTEKQMASKRARFNFNLRYRAKKYKGISFGLNGNVMVAQSNLAFAWLNDSSGLYQAYPGAVFLQNQFIFNLDPFLNVFTDTDGKHHFRMRLLYSNNEMTANQSNRSSTIYGDYMFKKSYKTLNGFDFIGGLTSTYTSSYANLYSGGGSPYNDILNISAYSQIEKKFQKTLNVSAGGRLEYFQLNDSITAIKPVFRAGTSIKLYQETYLRTSYGQGYRFPTITERYIRTGVGNFGVFPNPDVLPESSWNAEVGIKQGIKLGKIMGYFDIAWFWQEYENTIEYLFGFWGDPVADPNQLFGFKFINTGKSRILGIDISFSGKAKIGKNVELTFMTGYNYIVPKTLNPDFIYAVDELGRPYSYNSTSLDSTSQILKYRFQHNVKGDFEITIKKKLSIGFSVKYFSEIVNMDGVIEEFEIATVGPYTQSIRYMDYFAAHRYGNWIFDARVSYNINERHKIAVISANITNRSYSLRPLKIETPRTIMLQYTYKLDHN
ncbi:MAG: TonB-dependent receptor [Crocinitomicaceae bacterium]|nr:TonB-dependent receptor [Flavobacteriales bacterium]NQZ35213.1 TonB-dependent receptor [Crocinitomicaceae bacterium]